MPRREAPPAASHAYNVNQTDKGKRVPSQNSKAPCPSIHWKNPSYAVNSRQSKHFIQYCFRDFKAFRHFVLKAQNALAVGN